MDKYLVFSLVERKNKKTLYYIVSNKITNEPIAIIKWASNFRKYATFPIDGTYYDSSCEREMADFKDKLMKERLQCKGESE